MGFCGAAKKKQIPPLRCGMTNKRVEAELVAEGVAVPV